MDPARAMKSLTICMPTLNGYAWLKDSAPFFLEQDYPGEWEWLILDSGSTDQTVSFMSQFERVRIHHIKPEEFGHGKTRNHGVQLAKGDLIVMTVQDALPRTSDWLSNLAYILDSYELDGVCGGQAVPHDPDKNPIQWYRPIKESKIPVVWTSADFATAKASEKMHMCSWDNVNALYRKEALRYIPFEDVRFGEDMVWAKSCLENGGKIGYANHLKVWHYHHQHSGFTYKRVIYNHFWRHQTFKTLPRQVEKGNYFLSLRWLITLVVHSRVWNPIRVMYWLRYNHYVHTESKMATVDFLRAAELGTAELHKLYNSLGDKSPMATK
jgi:glycosyltransferase involved in cell wall biosynthesis